MAMSAIEDKLKMAAEDLSEHFIRFAQNRAKNKIQDLVDEDATVEEVNSAIEEEYGGWEEFIQEILNPKDVEPEEVVLYLAENMDDIDLSKYMD
jgi:hypothetical protein